MYYIYVVLIITCVTIKKPPVRCTLKVTDTALSQDPLIIHVVYNDILLVKGLNFSS